MLLLDSFAHQFFAPVHAPFDGGQGDSQKGSNTLQGPSTEESEFHHKRAAAGFERIDVEPVRMCRAEIATSFPKDQGIDFKAIAPQVDGEIMTAFIRACKPIS